MSRPQTYFQLSEGIFSPRDQRYSYRPVEIFETRAAGARMAKALRKDGFTGPMLLEQVTLVQVWDAENAATRIVRDMLAACPEVQNTDER